MGGDFGNTADIAQAGDFTLPKYERPSSSDHLKRGAFPERPLSRLKQGWALLVLALLVAVAVAGGVIAASRDTLQSKPIAHAEQGTARKSDLPMYRSIAQRVTAGEYYYAAATSEHRKSGYPTAPFVTVRQPTLAWLYAVIGERGFAIALTLLAIANALTWPSMLPRHANSAERICLAAAILAGSAVISTADLRLLHELWAGLLLSLSLALYRPRRWWPSLLLVAAALAIREIALPFALLWCAFAALERRWREFTAVAGMLALFGAGLAFHAMSVQAAVRPGDLVSPGWSGMHGPMVYIDGIFLCSPLVLLPQALAPAVVALSVLGYASWGQRQGWFALLWLTGVMAMVGIFGRDDNWYWAVLTLPMALGGLTLAPRALASLAGTASARCLPDFVPAK